MRVWERGGEEPDIVSVRPAPRRRLSQPPAEVPEDNEEYILPSQSLASPQSHVSCWYHPSGYTFVQDCVFKWYMMTAVSPSSAMFTQFCVPLARDDLLALDTVR
eukprot:6175032-Pleurochrysis_carterae.AAC.1